MNAGAVSKNVSIHEFTIKTQSPQRKQRLTQIQLQFAQVQRLMTALSEMMQKFNDSQQRLIQNLGR